MHPDGGFRGVDGEDAVLQPLQLRRLRDKKISAERCVYVENWRMNARAPSWMELQKVKGWAVDHYHTSTSNEIWNKRNERSKSTRGYLSPSQSEQRLTQSDEGRSRMITSVGKTPRNHASRPTGDRGGGGEGEHFIEHGGKSRAR